MHRRFGAWLAVAAAIAVTLFGQCSGQEVRATIAARVLQEAYYNNVTGLWDRGYSEQGFWNSANTLETMANYRAYTGDSSYDYVFNRTYTEVPVAYVVSDMYFDDQLWWCLAWARAFEVTNDERFLAAAEAIFQNVRENALDDTCGGGVWWSTARTYKNAITNELFLMAAASLATYDHKLGTHYLEVAKTQWAWFEASGMINDQWLINDGLNTSTCLNNNETTWTYNQGVILGGIQLLATSQAQPNITMLEIAQNIANATITVFTERSAHPMVLEEIGCDAADCGCNNDQAQFKGIFARYLGYTKATISNNQYHILQRFNGFLSASSDGAYEFDRSGVSVGVCWDGPYVACAGVFPPTTESSALDLFLANLVH